MQADPLGDPLGVLDGGVGHHDHEFLAAIAARQVDGADIGSQAHRELAQHLVADVVAVAVVDLLEVVDVDQQAGHRVAAVGRPAHQRLELAGHVAAVVQAGELVGDRQFQGMIEVVAQIVGVALAPDLRAGAALVIAGLVAEGITVIDDIYFIERGYEEFDQKLRGIGAQIEKVSDEKEIQKFILKVS